MSKTYILQKDLPGVMKGAPIEYDTKSENYWIKSTLYEWSRGLVEGDDGTWFKLEEPKSNDSFQWTDELVEKLLSHQPEFTNLGRSTKKEVVRLFREKHTPKPQAENKPDWEIVAFEFADEIFKYKENFVAGGVTPKTWQNGYLKAGYRIYSVKRLSDGEVFSVGDEVDVFADEDKGFRDKIHHFTHSKDIIDVYFENDKRTGYSFSHWLRRATKLPPQPQKEEQRITVSHFRKRPHPRNPEADAMGFGQSHEYAFNVWHEEIPEDKVEAIKQAIEQVLNSKQ